MKKLVVMFASLVFLLLIAIGAGRSATGLEWQPDAQSELCLRGRVLHESGMGPLKGAAVAMLSAERGTLTDSLGRYRFCDLPPGEFTVEVRMIGFYREQRDVHLKCPGGLVVGTRRCLGEDSLNFYMRSHSLPIW